MRSTHLWSSLYHSKEAGGTAIASQRKMAVLPKCAGVFFVSVIMGGSSRRIFQKRKGGNKGETEGGNSAISIHLHHRDVESGMPCRLGRKQN